MSDFPAGTGVTARKEGTEYAGTTVGDVINYGGRSYYIVKVNHQKVLNSDGYHVWQAIPAREENFHAGDVEQTQQGRRAKWAV
ncbi:hypothetical protein INS49_002737 [Diaporthe citri]|uniref:uncharacterized protein n=1 Tax=Diaporthe citri TaxID=83186 RepID=UPI001C7EB062|nr:uncharacterized protein INS49_002737 [Diaporthe citri]KAG6368527.1 hypothetical protein INS49_002737 [Diaporthe citri]